MPMLVKLGSRSRSPSMSEDRDMFVSERAMHISSTSNEKGEEDDMCGDLFQYRAPPPPSPSTESSDEDESEEDESKSTSQKSSESPSAPPSHRGVDTSHAWDSRMEDAEFNGSSLVQPSADDPQGAETVATEPSPMTANARVVSPLALAAVTTSPPVPAPSPSPTPAKNSSQPQQSTAAILQPRLSPLSRIRSRSSTSGASTSESAAPLPPPSPTQGCQISSQSRKRGQNPNTPPASKSNTQLSSRSLQRPRKQGALSSSSNRDHSGGPGDPSPETSAEAAEVEQPSRMLGVAQVKAKRACSYLAIRSVQANKAPAGDGSTRGAKAAAAFDGEATRTASRKQRYNKDSEGDSLDTIAVSALSAFRGSSLPHSPSSSSKSTADGEIDPSGRKAHKSLAERKGNGDGEANMISPEISACPPPLPTRKTASKSKGRTVTISTHGTPEASTAALRPPLPAPRSRVRNAATGAALSSSSSTLSGAATIGVASVHRTQAQPGDPTAGGRNNRAGNAVTHKEIANILSVLAQGRSTSKGAGGLDKVPTNGVIPMSETSPLTVPHRVTSKRGSSVTDGATSQGEDSNEDFDGVSQRQGQHSDLTRARAHQNAGNEASPVLAKRRRGSPAQGTGAADRGANVVSKKRPRRQSVALTSVPASDTIGNVAGHDRCRRTEVTGGPSESEPSTTLEEDLALVREQQADYEGLLAIHGRIVREIVALQAEEDELRAFGNLPSAHLKRTSPLPSPMLPLAPALRKSDLKVQKRAAPAKPDAPVVNPASTSTEGAWSSPGNDTEPESNAVVGFSIPVPASQCLTNNATGSDSPSVRGSLSESSREGAPYSSNNLEIFQAKETIPGCSTTDDADEVARSKGETCEALQAAGSLPASSENNDGLPENSSDDVRGSPLSPLVDVSVPTPSSGSSNDVVGSPLPPLVDVSAPTPSLRSSNGMPGSSLPPVVNVSIPTPSLGSSNDVLVSPLPPLSGAPVGTLGDSHLSSGDGANFDMEELLFGESDNDDDDDDDDDAGGAQAMGGKAGLAFAALHSDEVSASVEAPAQGPSAGAVGVQGRRGRMAYTAVGSRGRGRCGRDSGVRPAPARTGPNRPRYVDLNATYKRHNSGGGRGRRGGRIESRGSSSMIASKRGRGSGRSAGRST